MTVINELHILPVSKTGVGESLCFVGDFTFKNEQDDRYDGYDT